MGTSYTIVAIPSVDDYVWRISSEKVPHMTLLFLGDSLANQDRVADYLQYAAETSLTPFGMEVDRRGTLGPQDADVLFFRTDYTKRLLNFRSYLLANEDISLAYKTTQQYPSWIPHLTLGYPTAPAKKDDRDYPGINWVNFDRVALWTDDFDGPEFQLKNPNNGMEVSMSNEVDEFLAHFGIKGMHWGVRKAKNSVPLGRSEDAKTHRSTKKKTKVRGTDALSDAELKALVERMNLEQRYKKMTEENSKKSAGKAWLSDVLKDVAKDVLSDLIKEGVKKATSGESNGEDVIRTTGVFEKANQISRAFKAISS